MVGMAIPVAPDRIRDRHRAQGEPALTHLIARGTARCQLPGAIGGLFKSKGLGVFDNNRGARILSGVYCGLDMTREQISDFCIVSLAKVLRIPRERVQTDAKFHRLGLDSAMAVYLMMELEEKLDLELSMDDFYDYPTVDDLSRYLAEQRAERSAA